MTATPVKTHNYANSRDLTAAGTRSTSTTPGTSLALAFLMLPFALAGIAICVEAGLHDLSTGERLAAIIVGVLLTGGAITLASYVLAVPLGERRARTATHPTAPGHSDDYSSLAVSAFFASFVAAIPGIVLGHLALRDIARTGRRGRGLAIAALIISYSLLAIGIVFWTVILIVASQ